MNIISITLSLLVWSIKSATSELDVSQEAVGYSVATNQQLQDELIALKRAMFNEITLLKQKAKSDKADMLNMKIKFESDIESAKKRQAKMTSGFSSIVADVKKRLSYLENLHKVDGGWSDWTDWTGNCSTFCGVKLRNRTCTNPSPAHGGSACYGKTVETTPCNTISCPNYVIKSSHTASCSHGKGLTQSECQNEALIFAKASKHKYAAFFQPDAWIRWGGTSSWTVLNFGCNIADPGYLRFNSDQSGRNVKFSYERSVCKN